MDYQMSFCSRECSGQVVLQSDVVVCRQRLFWHDQSAKIALEAAMCGHKYKVVGKEVDPDFNFKLQFEFI